MCQGLENHKYCTENLHYYNYHGKQFDTNVLLEDSQQDKINLTLLLKAEQGLAEKVMGLAEHFNHVRLYFKNYFRKTESAAEIFQSPLLQNKTHLCIAERCPAGSEQHWQLHKIKTSACQTKLPKFFMLCAMENIKSILFRTHKTHFHFILKVQRISHYISKYIYATQFIINLHCCYKKLSDKN